MGEHEQNQYRGQYLIPLLLILGVLIIYFPAVNGDFIFDDAVFIVGNPRLRSLDGLIQIWLDPKANLTYYPLTFTTFWIEFQLWKLWPTGYHLVSMLLHGINAILLWALLRQLLVPGALIAAIIFAFHPVQVESVAWISEQKNLLSGFFYLLTLHYYLRFTPFHLDITPLAKVKWSYYWVVLLSFLCALLSKTVTCSLPAVLLVLMWWKVGRIHIQHVLPLLPLFVVGFAASSISAFLEWHPEVMGATGEQWNFTFAERILIAGRALWFYLTTLFWPVDQAFFYPHWSVDSTVRWQYVFPIGVILVFGILFVRRQRMSRAPLAVALLFTGTLLPTLGFLDFFFMRYSFVADHFQYLSSMSIIAGIVGWVWHREHSVVREAEELASPWWLFARCPLRTLLATTTIIVLAILTAGHAAVYRDGVALWSDTVEKNPNSWAAHSNLGSVYLGRSEVEKARVHLEKALSLNPHETTIQSNLSVVYSEMGKVQQSLQYAQAAFAGASDSPVYASNLSLIYWRKGDLVQAARYARVALRKNQTAAQVYFNIGMLALQEAVTPDAFSLVEAISYIEKALQLDPDFLAAMHTLAWLRATTPEQTSRDGKKALILAEEVCRRTEYRDPNFLDTLAAAYAEDGQFDVASDAARTAMKLARAAGRFQLEARIKERLNSYQAGTPYYDEAKEKTSF